MALPRHLTARNPPLHRIGRLAKLNAVRYRCLRDVTVDPADLNVFIGANGTGKRTILDALRFLREALLERDYDDAVYSRGGPVHLAWKGADASNVELKVTIAEWAEQHTRAALGDTTAESTTSQLVAEYEWFVQVSSRPGGFAVEETVQRFDQRGPPGQLLECSDGRGWWWSGKEENKVKIDQPPRASALASAAADAAFPGRTVADHVRGWPFLDPSPCLLRHDWPGWST